MTIEYPPPAGHPDRPLVSIITVVKNGALRLEETIKSVVRQTYSPIEYLIIDGKSSDGTVGIVENYSALVAHFVSEADTGIYDAINKGILASTGSFVCTLHAADRFSPTAIEQMVKATNCFPHSIVYTDCFYGEQPIEAPEPISPAFNLYNMAISHQSLMVPACLYRHSVGLYRTDFRIVSDHIWMRAAFNKGIPFHRVREKLLRIDDTGLSSGKGSTDRDVFESEAVRRVQLEFPFVISAVGRSIYRLRFSDEPLEEINDWLAMLHTDTRIPEQDKCRFTLSLEDYVRRVCARRRAAVKNGYATHPGAL